MRRLCKTDAIYAATNNYYYFTCYLFDPLFAVLFDTIDDSLS